MTDIIEIIRERHLRDDRWRNLPSMICPQAHDDRATLLAEVERLRDQIEQLRADNERLRAAATSAGAALAAAIELLERGGKTAKKAAPSDLMFDQMLKDYRAIVEKTRKALGVKS